MAVRSRMGVAQLGGRMYLRHPFGASHRPAVRQVGVCCNKDEPRSTPFLVFVAADPREVEMTWLSQRIAWQDEKPAVWPQYLNRDHGNRGQIPSQAVPDCLIPG